MKRGFLFRRRQGLSGAGPALALMGLVIGLSGLVPGCQPPAMNFIEGTDGPVRLEAVNRIIEDEDLTEDEQRQALRDLGITDEELIEVFMQGTGS